jgi:predicted 2-oxoglutarate/Fe(II)-dependent dioxygenase YbiX
MISEKKSMSMDVRDYLKIYDDFLDSKICKAIAKKLKKTDWQLHTFYQSNTNSFKSYEKELSVGYGQEIAETPELQKQIWFAIERYIVKDHAYMADWFSGWNGYSQVRYNRYNVDTQMKLHCDHIHSMFDGNRKGIPTLSILGAINDDYEGGELIFWESEKIVLKAGSIMIFPSNFMYPHKVLPVTKGTRYSYVSWAW